MEISAAGSGLGSGWRRGWDVSADLMALCSLFLSCLVAEPNQVDVVRRDWISAEWKMQLLKLVELLQSTQEVQLLLGLLLDGVYVGGPLQVL